LLKLAGVVGGIYFVTNYLLERLEELREELRREQLAKEKRVRPSSICLRTDNSVHVDLRKGSFRIKKTAHLLL
jgi:hypothetical protein